MTTRSKFYVSRVESHGGHDGGAMGRTAHLNVVYSQKAGTENYSYWKASPNGTMRLTFCKDDPCQSAFEAGTFWYVDVSPVATEEGSADDFLGSHVRHYLLSGLSRPYKGGLGVVLERPQFWRGENSLGGGRLEITIDNELVWPMFQRLDSRFSVVLVPAS